MADQQPVYDLVLTGARVCDPASGLDRIFDVAVAGDRIAAVGDGLAPSSRRVIDLSGKLVTRPMPVPGGPWSASSRSGPLLSRSATCAQAGACIASVR